MGLDLAAAAKLMNRDVEKRMNAIARNAYREGSLTMESAPQPSNSQNMSRQDAPLNIQNSSLPKEILESFQANPGVEESHSVLDTLLSSNDMQKIRSTFNEQKQVSTPITNPTPQVSSNIDYSLIKTIVEDSVKKYMGAYTKKILSEQKNIQAPLNEVNIMTVGKEMTLIGKNGDIYKAKLTRVGNVNDKK